jgi:hypothetical protein
MKSTSIDFGLFENEKRALIKMRAQWKPHNHPPNDFIKYLSNPYLRRYPGVFDFYRVKLRRGFVQSFRAIFPTVRMSSGCTPGIRKSFPRIVSHGGGFA